MGRGTTPTLCMGNWVVDSGLSHIGLHLNEKNNGTYNSHYTKRRPICGWKTFRPTIPLLMIVCIVLDKIDNNCILHRNKALLFLLMFHIQCN